MPKGHARVIQNAPDEAPFLLPRVGDIVSDLREHAVTRRKSIQINLAKLRAALAAPRPLTPDPVIEVSNLQLAASIGYLNGRPLDAIFGSNDEIIIYRRQRDFRERALNQLPDSVWPTVDAPGLYVFERHHLTNYFHWLNDSMPRLLEVAEHGARVGIRKVVVNAASPGHLRYKLDSLRLHFPMLTECVVQMPQRRYWLREGFTGPSASLSNYAAARGADPATIHLGRAPRLTLTARRFLDYVDETVKVLSGPVIPKMYISRSDAKGRQVMDEAALMAALSPLGFRRVLLSEHSHAEQVAMFRNAEVIIGPHGAGYANLMFCRPGTRVIELVTQQYMNQSVTFIDISRLRGLRHSLVIATEDRQQEQANGGQGHDIRLGPAAIDFLADEARAA